MQKGGAIFGSLQYSLFPFQCHIFSSPPSLFLFLSLFFTPPFPLSPNSPHLSFLILSPYLIFFLSPSALLSLGDGKTHYIQQQLASSPASLTIAVNEAFEPLNAISKLRSLPFNHKECAIFFNFTMLPPGVRDGTCRREEGKVDTRPLLYKEIGFVIQTQLWSSKVVKF